MTATTTVHPAKAVMDAWRTTTPRPILDVVTTERTRDSNGNTVFVARCGLVTVREQRDYSLTDCENHLAVVLMALAEQCSRFSYRLLDLSITVTEGKGTFVMERLP
jgi:hypothetical protein